MMIIRLLRAIPRTVSAVLILCAACLTLAAEYRDEEEGGDEEIPIPRDRMPAAVLKAAAREFPNGPHAE